MSQARYPLIIALFSCVGVAASLSKKPTPSGQGDGAASSTYLASLPRQKQYYVVDGDLLLTAAEIAVLRAEKAKRPSANGEEPYLKLGEAGVILPNNRKLTYAISRESFRRAYQGDAQYNDIVTRFEAAAQRWESVCPECGLKFIHQKELDSRPDVAPGPSLYMVVQYNDSSRKYLAASFYPKAEDSRRYVYIDPTFFRTKSYDRTGLLRHEIGHVLGYRHEHAGVPLGAGCKWEDQKWTMLTKYDASSVMHYLCDDSIIRDLELSELDIEGHRQAYAPRPE